MERIRLVVIGTDGQEHKGITIRMSAGKAGIVKRITTWLEAEL